MFKLKQIPTIRAILCFLAAVSIMLYPAVSSYVNEKYRSEIHTAYEEVIEQADSTELLQAKELAVAYNQSIIPGTAMSNAYSHEALLAASEDYDTQLNLTGDGLMGYVEVPKINVNLPVYHGTDSETLNRGVGHLLGSSLPIGGQSTHSILTGHSGMASQRLFTDLEQLEMGDVFYVHVLGETLAYQVDSINTVLPHDTRLLGISLGEDYCTLVTCTPVTVNTHRLLVRGTRIPYEKAQEVQEEIEITEEPQTSNWEEQYMLGIWLGIIVAPIAALISVLVIQHFRKHPRRKRCKGGRYAKKA